MRLNALIILLYGALVLAGGVIGYLQAGSQASLTAGLLSGALLIGSAIAAFCGKQAGELIALLLTFLLDGFFTYRFIATQQFMPSGMMSLLSLGVLLLLALRMRRRLSSPS